MCILLRPSTYVGAPLQDIITQHGLKCVMYADDTQLYVIFHPSDKNSAMQKLVTCVNDIKVWSTSNNLKFNDSKTEVMFFASRFVPTESLQTVNIGSSPVTPKSNVRNLGVMLDNGLCMTKHVSNVCRSAAMAIYKINVLAWDQHRKKSTVTSLSDLWLGVKGQRKVK